jgi:hypothetical protein
VIPLGGFRSNYNGTKMTKNCLMIKCYLSYTDKSKLTDIFEEKIFIWTHTSDFYFCQIDWRRKHQLKKNFINLPFKYQPQNYSHFFTHLGFHFFLFNFLTHLEGAKNNFVKCQRRLIFCLGCARWHMAFKLFFVAFEKKAF